MLQSERPDIQSEHPSENIPPGITRSGIQNAQKVMAKPLKFVSDALARLEIARAKAAQAEADVEMEVRQQNLYDNLKNGVVKAEERLANLDSIEGSLNAHRGGLLQALNDCVNPERQIDTMSTLSQLVTIDTSAKYLAPVRVKLERELEAARRAVKSFAHDHGIPLE